MGGIGTLAMVCQSSATNSKWRSILHIDVVQGVRGKLEEPVQQVKEVLVQVVSATSSHTVCPRTRGQASVGKRDMASAVQGLQGAGMGTLVDY